MVIAQVNQVNTLPLTVLEINVYYEFSRQMRLRYNGVLLSTTLQTLFLAGMAMFLWGKE